MWGAGGDDIYRMMVIILCSASAVSYRAAVIRNNAIQLIILILHMYLYIHKKILKYKYLVLRVSL